MARMIERGGLFGGRACAVDTRNGEILSVEIDNPVKREFFRTFAKDARNKLEEINKALGNIGWFSIKDSLGRKPGFPILCFKNSRDRRNLRIVLLPITTSSMGTVTSDNLFENCALFISSFPFRILDTDKCFNATMELKNITVDQEKKEVIFKGKSYHLGLPSTVSIGRGIGYKDIYIFPRGLYGLLQASRDLDSMKEGWVFQDLPGSENNGS